jgi:virulence-associated protein VapD
MSRYAVAFDLDTRAMDAAGLSPSQRTNIYQQEIPAAFATCGFTRHPQGSLYLTEDDPEKALAAVINFQKTVQTDAPNFCRFVSNVQIFRADDWSDITRDIRMP